MDHDELRSIVGDLGSKKYFYMKLVNATFMTLLRCQERLLE